MNGKLKLVIPLVITLLGVLFNLSVYAEIKVDSNFGKNGLVYTDVNSGAELYFDHGYTDSDLKGHEIIQLSSGKLLVIGTVASSINYFTYTEHFLHHDSVLVRYNSDGSLDQSFGRNGMVKTSIHQDDDAAISVIEQSDGKLVVAGYADESIAIVRYLTDGSLDTTFGTQGVTQVHLSDDYESKAPDLIQLKNGKFLVSSNIRGSHDSVSHLYWIQLFRLDSNGQLDSTFGENGIASIWFDYLSSPEVGTFIEQADGKLMTVAKLNASKSYLVRFQANGQLDTNFAVSGKFDLADSGYGDLAQLANGQFMVLTSNAVKRFFADGTQDLTYGSAGKFSYNIEHFTNKKMLIQPDGKVIVAGTLYNYIPDPWGKQIYNSQTYKLFRININGTLDTSFGESGYVNTTPMQSEWSESSLTGITLQQDNKIVTLSTARSVTGTNGRYRKINYSSDNLTLTRYDANGQVDNTFDNNGTLSTWSSISNDRSTGIKQLASGKTLVYGNCDGVLDDICLVKYNLDGSLDKSFSRDGRFVLPRNSTESIKNVFELDNGQLLIAASNYGQQTDWNTYLLFVRLEKNGAIDLDFGINGILETNDEVNTIYMKNNYLLSQYSYYPEKSFHIKRYHLDGKLDTHFGTAGNMEIFSPVDLISGYGEASVEKYNTDDNGNTIVAFKGVFAEKFKLIRVLADGSLDAGFGIGGEVTTTIIELIFIHTIKQLENGQLILMVTVWNENDGDYNDKLVKLNRDGSFDTSFGTNGQLNLTALSIDFTWNILELPDGQLILPGHYRYNFQQSFDLSMTRISANGELDINLGDNGIFSIVGAQHEKFTDTIYTKGQFYIAGNSNGDFVLSKVIDTDLFIDSDNDGMPDEYELANGLDDPQSDADNDGLTNLEEFHAGTDPNSLDTDGDGVTDKWDNSPLDPDVGNGAFLDTDNDAIEDIAFAATKNNQNLVIFVEPKSGNVVSHVSTSWLMGKEVLPVPDVNGNGVWDFVVLGETPAGAVTWQLFDGKWKNRLHSNTYPSWFMPEVQKHALILPDINGNGRSEIAILIEHINGRDGFIVYDLHTRALIKSMWLPSWFNAENMMAVSDWTGNGANELVFSGKTSSNRSVWFRYDSLSGANLGHEAPPMWLTTSESYVGADINNNGTESIISLGTSPTGANLWIAQDARSGEEVKRVIMPSWFTPLELIMVSDSNGDGLADVAALGVTPAGKYATRINDIWSGVLKRQVSYASWYTPSASNSLSIIQDINDNGELDLLTFSHNGSNVPLWVKHDTNSGQALSIFSILDRGYILH